MEYSKKDLRGILLVVFGGICITRMLTDIHLPVLPQIAVSLHTTIFYSQLTVTLFTIGVIISIILSGILSDKFGRKRVLFIGSVFVILGSIFSTVSFNIYILLIGRFIQGIGSGSLSTIIRAVIRDICSGDKLAEYNSYFAMLNTSLLMISPLAGGYIGFYLGWRSCFLLMLMLSVICFVSLYLFPETNVEKTKELIPSISSINDMLTSHDFLSTCIIVSLMSAFIFMWMTASPAILQTQPYNINEKQYGWISGLLGTLIAVGAFCNSRIVNSKSCNYPFKIGVFITALASLSIFILALTKQQIPMLLMIFFLAVSFFCQGLIFPNGGAIATKDLKKSYGLATSIYFFIQMMGALLGSILGQLIGINCLALTIIMLSLSSTCLVINRFGIRHYFSKFRAN